MLNTPNISVFSDLKVLSAMKPAVAFLLLISLACLFLSVDAVSQGGFQAFCRNYEKTLAPDGKSCPKTHKPVCGTDGKTYQNRCAFCQTAMERSLGKLGFKHEGKC
ncbi:serine protease inhibitor Kazal-type 12 [Mus caroli]|uniref:Serine protease inhibitor Kazal-type 12 n=1 Tax=Mus caroli TaxID=10089 RepID=A0A6P5NUG4_MUSCR|nr:serine protease inhibitor Kazal-type 12 [Mus caroli]